jgi:wobble nucleotide-excising tRNase
MIEKIEISRCASFGSALEVMDGLAKFNYVYGANSTGKTTVSRVIADASGYPTCSIQWRAGTELTALVYNTDFVERNFNPSTDLKGIFTLGEKDFEAQNKLSAAKAIVDASQERIEQLNGTLIGPDGNGGKHAELTAIEQRFQDACWILKRKHDERLQEAFTGYRNSAEKFKDKLLAECAKAPSAILTQEDLEEKAKTVFGPSPSIEVKLSTLDDSAFLEKHDDPILKKRVIGKTDVDIAAMIQKLGNSDWVRQGIPFLQTNDDHCPFCQQTVPENLEVRLAEYFDETFEKDSNSISTLEVQYRNLGGRLQQLMQSAIDTNSSFLDTEKLKTAKMIFDTRFQLNSQRIENKRKEPSQAVELESIDEALTNAKKLVADANRKIGTHNRMVENLAVEKTTLAQQVWDFLAGAEIKGDYATYQREKSGVVKAIQSLDNQIAAALAEKNAAELEIQQIEKSTTSVQPTVTAINRILANFGFKNFALATAPDGIRYKILRPDGTDAKKSLSEGERSFITFLYFYHLLHGSDSSSGIAVDRIVVFDDPVSSLDSDILFVVSSLIKQVIEDVRMAVGYVKQVFVLTHNVHFHKQVTYNPRRTGILVEETFWTVHKANNASSVRRHISNPVKTSYDLLWSEVRSADLANQSLQNNIRRILENYFRILGGINLDDLCKYFEGSEKIICKSLVSWMHDGSHSVGEDLYLAADSATMQKYLEVFHKIFDKSGHENHYKMMMGDDYYPLQGAESASPAQ